jgi:hypothetical protein
MTYGTLMYLVKGLQPFVKPIMFVKAPLKRKKAFEVVLYRFVHEVNANIIVNRFNVPIFIMHKYVDIVVDALIFKNKLLNQYILIPHDLCLHRIMDERFDACGIPNVCGTIDGLHNPHSQ